MPRFSINSIFIFFGVFSLSIAKDPYGSASVEKGEITFFLLILVIKLILFTLLRSVKWSIYLNFDQKSDFLFFTNALPYIYISNIKLNKIEFSIIELRLVFC